MKFIVSKNELTSLIGKIQNVVPSKPALPILSNVLIEAVADQLIISATDLTVSMRAVCEAKVLEEGAIALPAKKFFQLIRELTAPQVEIHSATSEIAFITAGTSNFRIQGMHKSEFPTLPDLSEGIQFSLPNSSLKELFSRTSFAAAREDSRQILNGLLLQRSSSLTHVVGTDGKRLAKVQIAIDSPDAPEGSYVLPLKAVEEIVKILENNEKASKITLMSDKFAIEVDSVTLMTKLLSGQYPDISRIIPKKSANPVALHREELISLLRQVALFTSEESSSVRFSFTDGALQLSAMSGEIGEGEVRMPVNYAGPKLDIAFNPHYFLDILRHSKDEVVHFDVTDSYNPGLITDSSNALFVIMPMRIEPQTAPA
jgi:DNA polymerase-3 subunit beta